MPRPRYSIRLPDGRSLDLGARTLVMGVINVTPDSFSDGGILLDASRAIEAGERMAEDGADLLDVGGESTRPGALAVSAAEERRRVVPVVERLSRHVRLPLSVDTWKAEVAEAAIDAGATIVNDISGLQFDPGLARLVARRRTAIVLMHTRGRPADMAERAVYASVLEEVTDELASRLRVALEAGIDREATILDPGLGFAKRAEHTVELLARLDAPPLASLGRPWLVGPSRKSFLLPALGDVPPGDRDWGTTAAVTAAVFAGAHIVRVHRVREMVQVVRVADMIDAQRGG